MRRAYFVELLRARIALVPLAVVVCGLMRAGLTWAEEGPWSPSAGQSIAAIFAYAIVLPVLAFVAARVEGELGSAAWLLARPIPRRSLAGLRVLADATVLGLATAGVRLVLGEVDAATLSVKSDALSALVQIGAAFWRGSMPSDPMVLVDRSPFVSWAPIGWISAGLGAMAYGAGLLSALGGRRAAARAAVLTCVAVAFAIAPLLSAPLSLSVLRGLAVVPWSVLPSREGSFTPWAYTLVAWTALAPVVSVLVTFLVGVAAIERRPSAPRLRPVVVALAAVAILALTSTLGLVIASILDAPAIERRGTSRLTVRVVDSQAEVVAGRRRAEIWLQTPGTWAEVDPWIRGMQPPGRGEGRTPLHRRWADHVGGEPGDVKTFSHLPAGAFEICAQVDPLIPNGTFETFQCWRREAATRRIEATCVPIEIAADTDHGTVEIVVETPAWDGTCPPEPVPPGR